MKGRSAKQLLCFHKLLYGFANRSRVLLNLAEIIVRPWEFWGELKRLLGLLGRQVVAVGKGTDVSTIRLYPGFSLHDELALFVQAGLTPGEALKTAMYNPAKFLGMLDRLGTIEKGKLADLVLLDANPLDDITNTQKIRAVLLNGKYFDRTALDRLLADAVSVASTQ